MGSLTVFNFATLNGYFKGPQEDISWHEHGAQENEYAAEMLESGDTLLFGRGPANRGSATNPPQTTAPL